MILKLPSIAFHFTDNLRLARYSQLIKKLCSKLPSICHYLWKVHNIDEVVEKKLSLTNGELYPKIQRFANDDLKELINSIDIFPF